MTLPGTKSIPEAKAKYIDKGKTKYKDKDKTKDIMDKINNKKNLINKINIRQSKAKTKVTNNISNRYIKQSANYKMRYILMTHG